ncbi:hypothetical protein ACFWHF_14470 [Streptomyces griseoincarnatus]
MAWEELLVIRDEACQYADDERMAPPAACPHDGEPLTTGPDGRLFCRFDGWRPQ